MVTAARVLGRASGTPLRALCGLLVLAGTGLGWWAWRDREAGQALYEGRVALQARLAGNLQTLPTPVARCVNCHENARNTTPGVAAATAGLVAAGWGRSPSEPRVVVAVVPALTGDRLARSHGRRGGPATRYSAAALCTLLRSGVDPAQVVVSGNMPRYAVSDAQCRQLMHYLESR